MRAGWCILSPQPDGTVAHAARPLGWEQFRFCDGGEPLQVAPVDEGTTIPKIIHQTEEPSTIREQFIPNINQLKRLNKGYKYIYYSEKDRHDFIYQHYGWDILKVYLRINPRYGAVRADLFRYLCLYRYGGIYLDMKSGCDRPFSDIIQQNDTLLLSHWMSAQSTRYHSFGRSPVIGHLPYGEFQQWFMISAPGHKLIKNVIDQVISNIMLYDERIFSVGKDAVLGLTGPHAFTRALMNHVTSDNARLIDSEREGIIYEQVEPYERLTDYRHEGTPIVL